MKIKTVKLKNGNKNNPYQTTNYTHIYFKK